MSPSTFHRHPHSRSLLSRNESKSHLSPTKKHHQSSKSSPQQKLRTYAENPPIPSSLNNELALSPHNQFPDVQSQTSTVHLRSQKLPSQIVITDAIAKIGPNISRGQNFKTLPRQHYVDLTVASARMVGLQVLGTYSLF